MIFAERGEELRKSAGQNGLSMVFAAGKRPSVDDVVRLLASPDMAGAAAHVSYRPPDDADGWLELLVSGLTFDLSGLRPGKPTAMPPHAHNFGLGPEQGKAGLEAIGLVPGRHIASGFAMIPVVQAMTTLAAHIALPLGAEAVCWHPAASWMEPQYFSRVTLNWLSGGAFPALGLTAVGPSPEGGVHSEGLAFFAGQELQVDGRADEPVAETAKLAVRFIDYIVNNGPFRQDLAFDGPGGERLRLESSRFGRLVTIRRGA